MEIHICFHCTSTEATPTLQGLLSLGDSIPRGLRNDDWSWGNLSNNSSYIQQSSEQLWKTCRNLLKTLKTPWTALALKARQDVWQILNKGRLLMENWCLLPAKHRVMQNAQCTDLASHQMEVRRWHGATQIRVDMTPTEVDSTVRGKNFHRSLLSLERLRTATPAGTQLSRSKHVSISWIHIMRLQICIAACSNCLATSRFVTAVLLSNSASSRFP